MLLPVTGPVAVVVAEAVVGAAVVAGFVTGFVAVTVVTLLLKAGALLAVDWILLGSMKNRMCLCNTNRWVSAILS